MTTAPPTAATATAAEAAPRSAGTASARRASQPRPARATANDMTDDVWERIRTAFPELPGDRDGFFSHVGSHGDSRPAARAAASARSVSGVGVPRREPGRARSARARDASARRTHAARVRGARRGHADVARANARAPRDRRVRRPCTAAHVAARVRDEDRAARARPTSTRRAARRSHARPAGAGRARSGSSSTSSGTTAPRFARRSPTPSRASHRATETCFDWRSSTGSVSISSPRSFTCTARPRRASSSRRAPSRGGDARPHVPHARDVAGRARQHAADDPQPHRRLAQADARAATEI